MSQLESTLREIEILRAEEHHDLLHLQRIAGATGKEGAKVFRQFAQSLRNIFRPTAAAASGGIEGARALFAALKAKALGNTKDSAP